MPALAGVKASDERLRRVERRRAGMRFYCSNQVLIVLHLIREPANEGTRVGSQGPRLYYGPSFYWRRVGFVPGCVKVVPTVPPHHIVHTHLLKSTSKTSKCITNHGGDSVSQRANARLGSREAQRAKKCDSAAFVQSFIHPLFGTLFITSFRPSLFQTNFRSLPRSPKRHARWRRI